MTTAEERAEEELEYAVEETIPNFIKRAESVQTRDALIGLKGDLDRLRDDLYGPYDEAGGRYEGAMTSNFIGKTTKLNRLKPRVEKLMARATREFATAKQRVRRNLIPKSRNLSRRPISVRGYRRRA